MSDLSVERRPAPAPVVSWRELQPYVGRVIEAKIIELDRNRNNVVLSRRAWLEEAQKFKCPCHGSGFYITGVNFEGPAPRPLERWAVGAAVVGGAVVGGDEASGRADGAVDDGGVAGSLRVQSAGGR